MKTPENSKLFSKYTDPVSGVESYLLTARAAPLQQSFYFTNASMTPDGRYLWLYCGFPPAGDADYGRTLALVDFERDEVFHFPDTQFLDASPMVDSLTGEVYWCNKYAVYKRRPLPGSPAELVARVPAEILNKGAMRRIATHLTFSADHSELCFDAEVGNNWFLGSIHLAEGTFRVWQQFDYCYNHAQFSPADPDLILFAEDYWTEKQSGVQHIIRPDAQGRRMRLWTIRRGEKPKPWASKYLDGAATHEWWSGDGKKIYYVDGDYGAVRIHMDTGLQEDMDPYATWHAHSSLKEEYFVGDAALGDWYRGCASNINFYNGKTGKKIDIITKNPALFTKEDPCVYHMDPHPQFTSGDKYVAFTTTVEGSVNIGLTRVAGLIEKTC